MIPFKTGRLVAVVTALPVVVALLAGGAGAAPLGVASGPPSVEVTEVSPEVVAPGEGIAVGFDTSRGWPYEVDFRESASGGWQSFDGDEAGTAVAGANEVDVEVPADAVDGVYDVRVRLYPKGAGKGGSGRGSRPPAKPIDTAIASEAFTVEVADRTQFVADFSDDPVGEPPAGWSSQWRESSWAVLDDPSRLRHEVDAAGGQRALTWDEPGDGGVVEGDVEVHGVVRMPDGVTSTRFQMPLHLSGEAGSESAYYLDGRRSSVRINRYVDGSFTNLDSASLGWDVEVNTWYRVLLRRDGDQLKAKMWPNGTDEPEDWQITTTDVSHDAGLVGVSHLYAGSVNEWGWYSVGVDGADAPRAPKDLFPLPEPDPLKTGFEERAGTVWWTSAEEEHEFLEAVDAASDRMSYQEVGTSVEGRPLHLVQVGDPAAPDAELPDHPTVAFVCSQHGNEQAGREGCLQLIRDLALTDDPEVVEQLGETTVLFVPNANPDGQVADTRGNANGANINREHGTLESPEARTIARVLQRAQPEIVADMHECGNCANSETPNDFFASWSRNLNVDDEVHDLSESLVQDSLRPEMESEGFSSALYQLSSGTAGHERTLHTMAGLRHSLGVLVESYTRVNPNRPGEADDPVAVRLRRVDTHLAAARSVLRFHRDNADLIDQATVGSRERKAQEGADQSRPYVLEGADNEPPADEDVLDPPPCGYVLNDTQAAAVAINLELLGVATEPLGENGVFVPMAQEMSTVIPLLLDAGAPFTVVRGTRVVDCDDIPEPPSHTEPAQYATDFTEGVAGETPVGWSARWRDSSWLLADEPRRVQHVVSSTSGQRALSWDEPGQVVGDVEVFAMVRGTSANTLFTLPLHVSGDAGAENTYYADTRFSDGTLRISEYVGGDRSTLASAPFTAEPEEWYRVLLQRDGDTLRAKAWPDGTPEPDWMVEVVDNSLHQGEVGIGGYQGGSVADWAYVGVGVGGERAPHAPAEIVATRGEGTAQ